MMTKEFKCFVAMPYRHHDAPRLKMALRNSVNRFESYKVDFLFVDELARQGSLLSLPPVDPMLSTLKQADFVVCLFDGENLNITFEIGAAYALEKPIFLVLLDSQKRIPSSTRGLYWVRFLPDYSDAELVFLLREFLEGGIQGILTRPPRSRKTVQMFICHRSLDKLLVEPIVSRLQGMGYPIWYDSWNIKPGDSIPQKISAGIDGSTHFVIFLSKNTSRSNWVTKELNTALSLAIDNGKPRIIPVFLDEVGHKSIPTLLRELCGVSFYSRNSDDAFEEFLGGIDAA
jgi:hypothetical protein